MKKINFNFEKYQKLEKQGLTDVEICKRLKISRSSVAKYKKEIPEEEPKLIPKNELEKDAFKAIEDKIVEVFQKNRELTQEAVVLASAYMNAVAKMVEVSNKRRK